jgi:hypothetical protein
MAENPLDRLRRLREAPAADIGFAEADDSVFLDVRRYMTFGEFADWVIETGREPIEKFEFVRRDGKTVEIKNIDVEIILAVGDDHGTLFRGSNLAFNIVNQATFKIKTSDTIGKEHHLCYARENYWSTPMTNAEFSHIGKILNPFPEKVFFAGHNRAYVIADFPLTRAGLLRFRRDLPLAYKRFSCIPFASENYRRVRAIIEEEPVEMRQLKNRLRDAREDIKRAREEVIDTEGFEAAEEEFFTQNADNFGIAYGLNNQPEITNFFRRDGDDDSPPQKRQRTASAAVLLKHFKQDIESAAQMLARMKF